MNQETQSYYGSKAWANAQLAYGISVLQGKSGIVSRPSGLLQIALLIKENLEDLGFWWQSERLENWIHRFQRGDFHAQEDLSP